MEVINIWFKKLSNFKFKEFFAELVISAGNWFRDWINFNYKEYFAELKNIKWGFLIIISAIFYSISNNITNYLYPIICNYLPIPSNYSESYWGLISIIITLYSILRLKEIIHYRLLPTLSTFLIIYISLKVLEGIEKNSPFYFLKFNLWYLIEIKFIDFLLILFIIHFLPLKSFIEYKIDKNDLSLIDDSPFAKEDLYLREKFIKNLTNHLINTHSETSFSIGIIGDWGSGKTNLINKIKNQLERNPQNIIIEINPWQLCGISNTISSFFEILNTKLSFQKNSISAYYKNIIKGDYSNDFIKLLYQLLNLNQNEHKEHQDINDLIKKSRKKIYVFIDDIDRLTSQEIIKIFSFIRNTANFNNTFFIVPYDKNYIVNVLKNSNQFFNEKEYLNKIFQLEINLPEFKKSFYIDLIKEYLTKYESSQERVDKINFALNKIVRQTRVFGVELNSPKTEYTNIFESLIDNIRELKRFCNSLKIILTNVGDEADIFDLIILELIKNKNFELYNSIRSKKIIKPQEFHLIELFTLKSMELDTFLKDNPFRNDLKDAVELLLKDSTTKNSRSFIYPRNFYLYFSYQLFDNISLKDFEILTKSNEEEVIGTLSNWLSDPLKNQEIYTIISDLNFTSDFSFFKTLNSSILQLNEIISKDYRWLSLIQNRLIHNSYIENSKESIRASFMQSVHELLKNKDINPYFKAVILCEFQYQKPKILQLLSIQNILISIETLFSEYSTSKFVTYKQCNEFYMLYPTEVQGRIIPNPNLCSIYQSILKTNVSVFQTFIMRFLRDITPGPHSDLSKIEIVFDPWVKNIFPEKDMIEKLVNNLNPIDKENEKVDEIECIKNIILENLDQYYSASGLPKSILITEKKQLSILIEIFKKNKY